VRRRLALLVSATMAMMLLAFVVPLAIQIRALAADHALDAATTEAKQLSAVVATSTAAQLPGSVTQLIESADHHEATVFLPDGRVLGSRASRTAAVALAQRGRSITVDDGDGREILVAVQSAGGTVVIRSFVSNADLSRGVTQAWIILTAFALVLLILGMVVADRLLTTVTGRSTTWPRSPSSSPPVTWRRGRRRPVRRRSARSPAASTTWPSASGT
jgi:hypothetical protein